MLGAPIRIFRRVGYCFGRQSVYQSFADRSKAVLLRFAAEPGKGRLFGRRGAVHGVRIKALTHPVYVRRGTSDFLVLRDIFEDGEYEQVGMYSLPAEANVLDLGGNIGMSVLYFAGLCPRSRLIVVEPDSANMEMLRRNCAALTEARRLTAVRAFVAAGDGEAEIDRTDEAWGFKKSDGPVGAAAETVPCVSIPTLLERAKWDHIDLMKCDVEGAERELFADCGAWIHKVRNLIVETHPPYSPEALYADLKRAGWNYDVVYANPYTPSPRIFLSRV
jgi:FkbM family methyltransferase